MFPTSHSRKECKEANQVALQVTPSINLRGNTPSQMDRSADQEGTSPIGRSPGHVAACMNCNSAGIRYASEIATWCAITLVSFILGFVTPQINLFGRIQITWSHLEDPWRMAYRYSTTCLHYSLRELQCHHVTPFV